MAGMNGAGTLLSRTALAIGMCAVVAGTSSTAVFAADRQVVLNDTGEDACSTGQVAGLDPNGDNFLAVRSGPGTRNRQIDTLHTGDLVAVCDQSGQWYGVVYGGSECVGGSPEAVTQNGPYRGPCASGWVFSKYVPIIAG